MKRLRTAPVMALLLFMSSAALAQASVPPAQTATPLIPRSVLFGNPERASPQISPDGRMLAYLAPDQDVLNIWVRTLGKSDDRVVTNDRKRGIRNLVWQFDSKTILYLQDQNGDENWHVNQTNIATRKTRDLTPFEKARADIVALEPGLPDTALITLNKRNPELFDVYRLNLKGGEPTIDTENRAMSWTGGRTMVSRCAPPR